MGLHPLLSLRKYQPQFSYSLRFSWQVVNLILSYLPTSLGREEQSLGAKALISHTFVLLNILQQILGGKVSPPNLNLTWQSTAVSNNLDSSGLIPFSNLAGFPLQQLCHLLALEEDDVPVVFVYLSVGVTSPQFLDLVSCFAFGLLQIDRILHKIIISKLYFKSLYRIVFKIQHSKLMAQKQCVKVAVRCRPMASGQVSKGFKQIVEVDPERGQITVHNIKDAGDKERVFSFDMTFQPGCLQENVFKKAALPIIESVLAGYNGTIFAYGQTGTGKTHTMEGSKSEPNQEGIIPRTFSHVINAITGTPNVEFLVKVSMLELYNEQICDLLRHDNQKLQIHEDKDKGIYVKDLSMETVSTVEEMNKKLKEGSHNRHVGSTDMNKESSRSHSIFMIRVEQQEMINGESKIKVGKLNLVDLAGSERQKKTQATGNRSKEGIYINLALSTLGQVIKALVSSNNAHIPYRDSKLTRLLQESLGGNAKTIMIANVGPADYNFEQTMSTLRYASEAKKIKNKPKINEDPKDAMIRQYQLEIEKLKKMLQGKLPMEGAQIVEKKVKREPRDISHRLAKEKEKLEKQKKDLLGEDLDAKNELLKRKHIIEKQKEEQKLKQQDLALKLKEMKQKLMHGNKLKEQARLHQKKLFEAQQQLEERRQHERRLAEVVKEKEQKMDDVVKGNESLKEQVQKRRKQLAKINNKLKAAYEANNDIQQFMVQEREQLEQENRAIVRELKLYNMIIQHFVPIHEVAAIQHRLQFDDSYDDWGLVMRSKAPKPNPGSALGFKFPLCSQGRFGVACGDDNPRYRQDNILQLDLDQVPSTIQDFRYEISPTVIDNLSVVLNDNEQEQRVIAKEERPNVYIDDPQKMNKEEVMRQRDNATRAKSAKMMRPASGNRKGKK